MENNVLLCPKCGGSHVDVQVVQENLGSKTVTRTKSKYKEQHKGCLWWLVIGWWWWIVELFLWIVAFIPMLVYKLLKKKKYKGKSTSVSETKNKIGYKRLFVCKDCGHYWEK